MPKFKRDPTRAISAPHNNHSHAQYNSSLRIKGIEDDLPVVLKKPIEPEKGRELIKSGAFTQVTKGNVLGVGERIIVHFSDGSSAEFADQIMSDYMGAHGDSGSFVLTADTFEPTGLLFAGNEVKTYHNKLTNVASLTSTIGFYCPISLPSNIQPELRYIISSIIPDGFFLQKSNLLNTNPKDIIEQLGIVEIRKKPEGGFNVSYEDAMLTSNPHESGDEGSILS